MTQIAGDSKELLMQGEPIPITDGITWSWGLKET